VVSATGATGAGVTALVTAGSGALFRPTRRTAIPEASIAPRTNIKTGCFISSPVCLTYTNSKRLRGAPVG
jgi:hypothetical protein